MTTSPKSPLRYTVTVYSKRDSRIDGNRFTSEIEARWWIAKTFAENAKAAVVTLWDGYACLGTIRR